MSISGIGAYGYSAGGFCITKRGAKNADRANTTGRIDETLQLKCTAGHFRPLQIGRASCRERV